LQIGQRVTWAPLPLAIVATQTPCKSRAALAETSFNPEQTEMIAKAFDDAWTALQIDEDEPAMASLVRTALAKRIIEWPIVLASM
jgi:hypothetical protein